MEQEKENLEIDIGNKKHAYEKIQEVLNDLKDVEGLDEQYELLHNIAEEINDSRINDESKLERMEETEGEEY